MRAILAGFALAVAGLPAPVPGDGPALAVRAPHGWETWWQDDAAPTQWTGPLPAVADRVTWRQASPGVEWGEFSLSGDGEAFRVRVIVARLDPAQLEFRLVKPANGKVFAGRWAVDEAPEEAVFAVNAGQFTDDRPWGWMVQDGVERQAPGTGPLAPAVVVDSAGALRLVTPDSIGLVKSSARVAFQSYPTLLSGDGEVPLPLRQDGLGVDRTHRDARLALGLQRDGKVLVAMTRFELGGVPANIPLGLTTPEMAAVMGALGASRAVLLDGGISSQMLIRSPGGTETWTGWRKVALGLVVMPRAR